MHYVESYDKSFENLAIASFLIWADGFRRNQCFQLYNLFCCKLVMYLVHSVMAKCYCKQCKIKPPIFAKGKCWKSTVVQRECLHFHQSSSWLMAKLSTSIYNLVLVNVCHFHHLLLISWILLPLENLQLLCYCIGAKMIILGFWSYNKTKFHCNLLGKPGKPILL